MSYRSWCGDTSFYCLIEYVVGAPRPLTPPCIRQLADVPSSLLVKGL